MSKTSNKYRILFVCLGNICRSPAAELLCRDELKRAGLDVWVQADSCGTASYHVGRKPDNRIIAALKRAGYEYDGHRARMLVPEDGSRYDLIIPQDRLNLRDVLAVVPAFAADKVVPMSHWFPEDTHYSEVPDPYYGTSADFDDVVRLLKGSVQRLVADVRKNVIRR